jgi:hypothetical protein
VLAAVVALIGILVCEGRVSAELNIGPVIPKKVNTGTMNQYTIAIRYGAPLKPYKGKFAFRFLANGWWRTTDWTIKSTGSNGMCTFHAQIPSSWGKVDWIYIEVQVLATGEKNSWKIKY